MSVFPEWMSEHRRTIQTVRGIVMSRATRDLRSRLDSSDQEKCLIKQSRERPLKNAVNVRDHMSQVTSPCLEQFG